METFVGNIDWPANNNKFWRSRNGEGKWRWILYDTDTGYGLWDDWWADGTKGYYVNHILLNNLLSLRGNYFQHLNKRQPYHLPLIAHVPYLLLFVLPQHY